MRKALIPILIAGLSSTGLPAGAQSFGPDTIWGEVPQGVVPNAARAVLQDAGGRVVATVPVADGRFVFAKVDPGEYVAVVQDGASRVLATSLGISLASGATIKAVFGSNPAPAAARAGGGGLSRTGWILVGAAAVGVLAAVVIATNDDEGNQSPSR